MKLQDHSCHDRLVAIAFVGLLYVTFLLSKAALSGPFLFDDFPNLSNLAMLGGKPTFSSLAHFAAQYTSQPGRPLSMLSFAINDAAWPSDPRGFKYTNLMLHLLVGVSVFGLSRALASVRMSGRSANCAALLTASAWLLHPMQLATSMLVVQRMTQLSALFTFAGTWAYVALARRGRPFASIGALGIGTVLATLCKETGALAPLLALVINATILREALAAQSAGTQRLIRFGVGIPVGVLAVAIVWQWPSAHAFEFRGFSLPERLLTECRVLCDYMFRILVPALNGDGIYHDDFSVSHGLLRPLSTLPALLFIAATIAFALASRRKRPLLSFSLLWFYAGHLLESSVFPLELYFEHRNYLPMAGVLFGLSAWIASSGFGGQRTVMTGAVVWIALAGWLTSVQASVWGNAGQLATIWALEHPQSPRAIQQEALYLIDSRKPELAANRLLSAYSRGVRGSDFPLQALLVACKARQRILGDAASPLVAQSLRHGEYNNSILEALRNLRRAIQAETCPDIVGANDWLTMTDSVLRNPVYANGSARAYIHTERSYLRMYQRNLELTMQELEAAWSDAPTPELARMISATLASAGLYDQAILWARRSAEHAPGGLRGWLSQDDSRATRLEDALKQAQQAFERGNAAAADRLRH